MITLQLTYNCWNTSSKFCCRVSGDDQVMRIWSRMNIVFNHFWKILKDNPMDTPNLLARSVAKRLSLTFTSVRKNSSSKQIPRLGVMNGFKNIKTWRNMLQVGRPVKNLVLLPFLCIMWTPNIHSSSLAFCLYNANDTYLATVSWCCWIWPFPPSRHGTCTSAVLYAVNIPSRIDREKAYNINFDPTLNTAWSEVIQQADSTIFLKEPDSALRTDIHTCRSYKELMTKQHSEATGHTDNFLYPIVGSTA